MSTDERLAEWLEGLLDPEDARALEQQVRDDPRLAGRLAALQSALPEPAELPALELPPSLVWRVRAVVEEHLGSAEEHAGVERARLAAALEGAADPALERALRDPRVRGELLDLARAFAVGLRALEVPPALAERVLVRLEEERLVDEGAEEEPAVPAGLLEATLARLEAEGLVAAASGPPEVALVASRPAPAWSSRRWLAAAAAALVLGSAVAAAYALGRRHERAWHDTRPLALGPPTTGWQAPEVQRRAIREAREERDALREERDRTLAELASARAELTTARETRDEAEARLAHAEEASAAAEEASAVALAQRDQAEAAGAAAVQSASVLAGRLELVEQRLQRESAARVAAEDARVRAERALASAAGARARLERALEAVQGELVVEAADGAQRWAPDQGVWEPVQAGSALPRGTLVRGAGRGALVLAGRRYPLRGGAYVISAGNVLEPLPEPTDRARAELARGRGAEDLEAQVQGWVADLGSGSPRVRSHAQRELLELYGRLGDPGPGVVESWLRVEQGPPGVPLTAQAWLAWWERVDDTAFK
ncbi:MAG: hypothetical protein R3F62_23600 [Planctomycetota bacterium]